MKVRLLEDGHPVHAKAGTIGELEVIGNTQRFTPDGGEALWIGRVKWEPVANTEVEKPKGRQNRREK